MPALLVSVGGSPEPVLHALRTHHPAHVAYFCSAGTRDKAENIHTAYLAALPADTAAPIADYLEISAYEELGPCYAALRRDIPVWLARHGIPPAAVTVDYTGGTKTMSAALVLAASELFSQFSYIGGTQRDKAGVGIVLSGRECVHYQANPWRELAIRELDQAAHLWEAQQYEAVIAMLRPAKARVPLARRPAFDRVIDLAHALAARLALRLGDAAATLAKLDRNLAKTPAPPDAAPATVSARQSLQTFCQTASGRLAAADAASGPAADPRAQLRELLDNALLTARLGRHDDAAARLYRALELYGQNELSRLTAGAFTLGQLKSETLPAALADFPPFTGPDGPSLARRGIALEQVFSALAHLRHPAGLRAVSDFTGPDSLRSPWRAATQRRNQSILAHGLKPVGPEGFAALGLLVADYTGENTTLVELSPPAWDSAWFD